MSLWTELDAFEGKLDPLLIEFSDGKQAVVPMVTKRIHKGLVKTHRLSVAGAYGGWLSPDELRLEHAVLLSMRVLELGSIEWITNPCDPLVLNSGTVSGPADETQIVNIREGIEAVTRKGADAHRRAVRKAIRSGVAIRQAHSLGDWLAYYDVYRDSIRRWGDSATSNHPRRLFEAFWGLHSNNVTLWLAIRDGRVVAGALCLYAKRHAAYWHGAALESDFNVRPVNLLMHTAILDACTRGMEWFDLGLSGGHEGVRSFKRSLGAEDSLCATVTKATGWHRMVQRVARLEMFLKDVTIRSPRAPGAIPRSANAHPANRY
jgi:hypothetical protein